MGPMMPDPFANLGKALARLRVRAGFSTQTEASAILKIDKGQLSRWENDSPQPTVENLGRLLVGYGATVVDLWAALVEVEAVPRPQPEDQALTDEELSEALGEVIRRLEARQVKAERRLEQLEKELGKAAG